ncbi:gamma-crystallin M3-like [Xiphophorus hellerii]|uniref:gamma-crystallin M3-like n=1 Tax=Xiphophorus hellerii TaxID=8084 RepID=UPI0013B44A03|nr:gamma-crystallin M3-like [Xiphophorus hellerii]
MHKRQRAREKNNRNHERKALKLCLSDQIIFFEERNFQGRSYECVGDCSEITSHLRRCSSCRVESGIFMVYEQPNFRGQQYLLTKGDYPEYQDTIGFNDCIQSCRIVPVHTGLFKMRIYEKTNFEGQMHELTDDCDSIQDSYNMSDLQSCNVVDGYWLMFELPEFEGRMLYLKPGEYKNLREISNGVRFSSIRRITES